MSYTMSERSKRNLWIMIAMDVLALLVALYRQSRGGVRLPAGGTEREVYVSLGAATHWAWGIFIVMVIMTIAFALLSREKKLRQGLPGEGDDD